MEPENAFKMPSGEPSLMEQAIAHFHEHLDAALLPGNPMAPAAGDTKRVWRDWPDLRVNANVDFTSNGELVFRLSHGIYFALLDAAQSLALDPRFCPDLPVDEEQFMVVEEASASVRERFVDYSPALPGAPLCFPVLRTTAQESRQHLTDVLLALGIKFIHLHEQGHAYQGHLHFIKKHGGKLAWMEIAETASDAVMPAAIKPADRRALELQADAFACHILITRNLHSGPEKLYPGSHVLRNGVDWIFFSSLAAVLVYALLERADLSTAIVSGTERRHPSVSVRVISLFAELRQVLRAQVENEAERAVFMSRLLDECQVVFSLVGVNPIDTGAFNHYFSSDWSGPESPVAQAVWNYNKRLRELSSTLTGLSAQAKHDFNL